MSKTGCLSRLICALAAGAFFVCAASSAPYPALAANKPGTRDLVYEEEEPAKAAKAPAQEQEQAPDRDLGPGPFYTFSAEETKTVRKAIERAMELNGKGKTADALSLSRQVERYFASLPQPPDPVINWHMNKQLFIALNNLSKYPEAVPVGRKLIRLGTKLYGEDSDQVIEIQYYLANCLHSMSRYSESLPLQNQAFLGMMNKSGLNERALKSGMNLVEDLRLTNSLAQAIDIADILVRAAEKTQGAKSILTMRARASLATCLMEAGDYETAEKIVRQNLASMGKISKANAEQYLYAQEVLASILTDGPKKDHAGAAALLSQVMQIRQKLLGKDHPNTLQAELNLITIQDTMRDSAKAEQNVRALLPRLAKLQGEEHLTYLEATCILGETLAHGGKLDEGIAVLQDLLPAASANGDETLIMRVAGELRQALQKKGDMVSAEFFGRQAVNMGQTMRRDLKDSSPDIQKAFARKLEEQYQGLADVLMARGKTAEAQKVMGMLKENELADMAVGAPEAAPKTAAAPSSRSAQAAAPAASGEGKTAVGAGASPEVSARYQEISDKIVALGKEQRALLDKRAQGETLSPQEEERLKSLRQDMTAARKMFTAFMKNISAELAQGDKRAADLGNLETYQRMLATLGDGVVLLQTIVTDNRIWLILTTPTSQVAKESPFDVKTLGEKITAFRDALQDPEQDARPLAKEFYDALVGPLAPSLEQAKADMIMFSLDGQLRYIPMAALYDGQKWLVQKYNVSMFNDATKASLAVPGTGNWKVAGLGVTKEHKYGRGKFTALPAVKAELASIVHTKGGTGGALEGVVAMDESFTADKLQEVLETGYPVVHLASHFHFDKKNPEQSFLLLGDGTGLPLTQIESEDFKFTNVDLLALSACQTARGGVDASGKEIEGFGALAQKRGAKAVLATLWPVFDDSTGLLMSNFYRLHGGKNKTSIAAALRDSQLLMIDNKIEGKDFRHPFYWAPFVLMGDWR